MQEIIQKISEIYLRYGIKSITMDDLARDLGVSKKTLYLHFKDKKDVVSRVMEHLIEEQKLGINKTLISKQTNAIDKLMMMTHYFAEYLKNVNASLIYDLQKHYPDIWESVVKFRREEVFSHVMQNVASGIKEGLFRNDLNYEIIIRAYISRMEMYHTDLWQPLEKYKLEEVFSTLFAYHIRGIASPEGLSYLEKNIQNWESNKNIIPA